MACHILIPVADDSAIGESRRAATRLADAAGLGPADAGRAAIVVTELATNLARHVKTAASSLLIAADRTEGQRAVVITSIDSGPGMINVTRCFEDGYSTAGTPGNGLGAVRRLSDELDIFSANSGTVIYCRVAAGPGAVQTAAKPLQRTAALSVPAPLETFCGDAWRVSRSPDGRMSLMIADGLGHGPLAADASEAACRVFDGDPFAEPGTLMESMHAALSGTRGAAIAIARIDLRAGTMVYTGVGNIAGTLLSGDGASRGLFSHNGTVGHQVRKIQTFEYPFPASGLMVLHSDGLQTRWSLDAYPGITRRHPAVIAGLLLRDFRRARDDSTVVIVGPPIPGP